MPESSMLSRQQLQRRLKSLGIPHDYATCHALRRLREPAMLASIGHDIHDREQFMAPRAARAWQRMHQAAAADGITLKVISAFRSTEYQCGIIERKLACGQPVEAILAVNAAPGYSEHHSGRAVDIAAPGCPALEEEFEDSPAFAWLTDNAAHFRFTLSYPRRNRHRIAYEPWHWCWHRANR